MGSDTKLNLFYSSLKVRSQLNLSRKTSVKLRKPHIATAEFSVTILMSVRL